jgi:hypothetical protein
MVPFIGSYMGGMSHCISAGAGENVKRCSQMSSQLNQFAKTLRSSNRSYGCCCGSKAGTRFVEWQPHFIFKVESSNKVDKPLI